MMLHLHLLLGCNKMSLTHLHVLCDLVFGKFILLVLHVAASTLMLALQLCALLLGLVLLLLHLLGLLLEADQAELGNLFLDALLALHLDLLLGGHVVAGGLRLGDRSLVVGVPAGLVPRAHCALSSLAFGDGLKDDVTLLVRLMLENKVGRTAPIAFSFAKELARLPRYRC